MHFISTFERISSVTAWCHLVMVAQLLQPPLIVDVPLGIYFNVQRKLIRWKFNSYGNGTCNRVPELLCQISTEMLWRGWVASSNLACVLPHICALAALKSTQARGGLGMGQQLLLYQQYSGGRNSTVDARRGVAWWWSWQEHCVTISQSKLSVGTIGLQQMESRNLGLDVALFPPVNVTPVIKFGHFWAFFSQWRGERVQFLL